MSAIERLRCRHYCTGGFCALRNAYMLGKNDDLRCHPGGWPCYSAPGEEPAPPPSVPLGYELQEWSLAPRVLDELRSNLGTPPVD